MACMSDAGQNVLECPNHGKYLIFANKISQKRVKGKKRNTTRWNTDDKRILIVDDEPDVAFTFKVALENNGFKQVDTFNDPLLDLKHFKAGSYRLVILDGCHKWMDLNYMINLEK